MPREIVMADLIQLTETRNPVLAQPIVDLLRENGINAAVFSDDAGGNIPPVAFISGTRIMVPENELGRAREILSRWEMPF